MSILLEDFEERDAVDVLIVWQEVPETTKLYRFEVNRATAEWMRKAHNVYVNTVGATEHAENLMAFLESHVPIEGPVELVELVIVSGFIL